MIKKDPIFWWASGIFVLSLALFAISQNQFWLALMIGSYLLRPTLASLGMAKRYVDERQLNIHYRSGNIGFVVMIIVCVILAIKLAAENNHDFEMFIMAIVLGLAAKALFNVILVKNFRETMPKVIMTVGLLIALFASLDAGSFTGIIMSIIPGLAIVGIGLLAKKFPRIIGVIVIIMAIALMIFILRIGINWGQMGTAIVIGVPLLLAGVFLYKGDKKDSMKTDN